MSAIPKFIAIAAMASNRVIGVDGKLPWHLPEDLKFFKRTTLGQPVLMGRKTFESIVAAIGKPLPGRLNIVLSSTMNPRPDVSVIKNVDEVATLPGVTSPVYLIGGAQLYKALLPKCDELLLTLIDAEHYGDAIFPSFEENFPFRQLVCSGEGFNIWRYSKEEA